MKLVIYFLLALSASFKLTAAQPDWSSYDQLLQRYIAPKTVQGIALNFINYQGMFDDPAFEQMIAIIEEFPTETLITKEEKLAFYINAYNIFAIKAVHDHWPLESIKDAGNWFSPIWKKTVGRLNGKTVSLDDIEHKILRPMGEPRIHFAIVCASLSCPDLREKAFQDEHLYAQLDEQVKLFLNNTDKGLKLNGSTARISQIFDWFEEDFESQGGVKSFIKKYFPDTVFNSIDPDLTYNWALNGS